jgi:hypothetical protein
MILQSAMSLTPFTVAAGLTRYFGAQLGRPAVNATESFMKTRVHVAGTASKLWFRITSNGVSATSTITSRKNGADGNLTQSFGAGTTGEFSDLVNSDTIAANDDYNFKLVVGAGGTSIDLLSITVNFTASSNTYSLSNVQANMSSPTATTVYYFSLCGGPGTLSTSEVDRRVKMRQSGTAQYLQLNCSSNTVSGNTTVTLRKNTADTAITAQITGSTTGYFEETANTVAFADGDFLGFSAVTASGTGNVFTRIGVGLTTTDNTVTFAVTGSASVAAATTKYAATSGQLELGATETNTRVQINRALTASKLQVRVTTGGNGITGNSTFTLLKNGVATALGVQYGTSEEGYKSDDVNSVSIADGDELSIEMVGGAAGTTIAVSDIELLLAATATTRNTRSNPLGVNVGMGWRMPW